MSLQVRVNQTYTKLPVREHYDADKDFPISATSVYEAEGVLDYFGMEDINTNPTKHLPPDQASAMSVTSAYEADQASATTAEKKHWL